MLERITVRQLLKDIFYGLTDRHEHQGLVLPGDGAFELIANDDDPGHGGNRRAYMNYKSAKLLELEGRTWVLSRGTVCGKDYVAAEYDSEILAFPFESKKQNYLGHQRKKTGKQMQEEIKQIISKDCSYMQACLLLGLSDGELVFGRRMSEKFFSTDKDFVIKNKIDGRGTVYRYDPKFADSLIERIEQVFK